MKKNKITDTGKSIKNDNTILLGGMFVESKMKNTFDKKAKKNDINIMTLGTEIKNHIF